MIDRDTLIKLSREAGYGVAMADLHAPALERFAALVAAHEREACAQVCDAAAEPWGYGQTDERWAAATLAERIRARSNP